MLWFFQWSCTDVRSWTVKKDEHQRIVPWTARRSNQSILKDISPGCSLERLMLRLKLQYFGHLMGRSNSFEKTLMQERLKVGGGGDDKG